MRPPPINSNDSQRLINPKQNISTIAAAYMEPQLWLTCMYFAGLILVTGIVCAAFLAPFVLYPSKFGVLWLCLAAFPCTLLIGGIQHCLVTLGHDGSHFALHRHRLINDLIADWLFFFPVFTTTMRYRSSHASHHAHTNMPKLDKDRVRLRECGLDPQFPMTREQALKGLLNLMNPLLLLHYVVRRARFIHLDGQPRARAHTVQFFVIYCQIFIALLPHDWHPLQTKVILETALGLFAIAFLSINNSSPLSLPISIDKSVKVIRRAYLYVA